MWRKRLTVGLVVLGVVALGTYLFARAVLGSDLVRSTLEQQLAAYTGQPARIGSATATIYPRVSLVLHDVSVGDPPAIRLDRIRIATGLRGLLSRVINDAEVVIAGGRVTLPLPFPLVASAPAPAPTAQPSSPPLTVTSVKEISVRDVELVGGNQTLRLDISSALEGDRLDITSLTARAAKTRIEASGALTSLAKLEGKFDAKAEPLDLDEMIALGSALTTTPAASKGRETQGNSGDASAPMHLVLKLSAASGQVATFAFRDLSTTVDAAPGRIVFSPMAIRAFGGAFQGRLDADTRRQSPQLRLSGRLENVDVPEIMKVTGSSGGLTGRLTGTISLTGEGADSASLLNSARGTIAASITDGNIPGLDMVRTIVLAFGKPSGAPPEGSGSRFSRLGGTFALANNAVTTDDLAMRARDFDMTGRGTLRISSGEVNARSNVVLSEELTAQAGTDLRRYAQQDGRVVVPTTIGGTLQQPNVSVDIAAATRRAVESELKRRATTFIEGLFKKKKQ
jgi:uncharacterized protein involved in outer membrane biogenesis